MKLTNTTLASVALVLAAAPSAPAADSIEHLTARHCTNDDCVKIERWTAGDRQREITRDERTGKLVTETVVDGSTISAFYAPTNTLTIGPRPRPASGSAFVEGAYVTPDGTRYLDQRLSTKQLPYTAKHAKLLKLTPRPDAKVRRLDRPDED